MNLVKMTSVMACGQHNFTYTNLFKIYICWISLHLTSVPNDTSVKECHSILYIAQS